MSATIDPVSHVLPSRIISDLADAFPPLRTALDLADPGQELRQACEVLREHIKSLRTLLGQEHAAPAPRSYSLLTLRFLVTQAQLLERAVSAKYPAIAC